MKMAKRLSTIGWVAALFGLVACTAPQPIPDFRYFRLAPAAPMAVLPAPLLDKPLVLENFRADGVHGERPILYANDADSLRLSQYHYQLWNDPPPVMVQRRLQELFSAAKLASYITDRLSPREQGYRLTATVYRFERVLIEGRPTEAVLGIRLRLQADGAGLPLLERDELVRVPVSGPQIEDAAVALSRAVEQVAQRMLDALKKLKAAS